MNTETSRKVSPSEIKDVIASYSDTSDVKKIQSGGFRIAGEKYMTIKADEKSVYGKKVHETLPLCVKGSNRKR